MIKVTTNRQFPENRILMNLIVLIDITGDNRDMRIQTVPFVKIVAVLACFLAGCSGMKNADMTSPPTRTASIDPSDDAPLLPRVSAKELWESRTKGLPPLPEKPVVAKRTQAEPLPTPEPLQADTGLESPVLPAKTQAITTEQSLEPAPEKKAASLDKISPEGLPELVRMHAGKVILLNTWGVDCGPCVEELPHLDKIYQQYKNRGLVIIGLNSDTERRWPEVEKFVSDSGLSFPVYLKAPGSDTEFRKAVDPEYGADPFSVIYNRQGAKIVTIADALTLDEWNQLVEAVLQDKPIPITKPDVIRSIK
ncbi:MAG: TlpA family protein disulfide reductase [Candidatus Omnitrophica bacterium]|nr:TlpA family protein disulfide reductase [Candidatus Omnitrophota bacterium]